MSKLGNLGVAGFSIRAGKNAGRRAMSSSVAFGLALMLVGCDIYGFDAAMRQVTEPGVQAPAAMADDETRAVTPKARQSIGDGDNDHSVEPGDDTSPQPRAITNNELWQWRTDSLLQNAEQNPLVRPRRLPKPFQQVDWNNYLPLLSYNAAARLSSDYGWRNRYGRIDFHSGIDIVAPAGTDVFTPLSGLVISAPRGDADNAGLVILSGERQYSFWHMTPTSGLQAGSVVQAGQRIGTLANWGNRTHLHFAVHLTGRTPDSSVRNDNNAVDPILTTWRALNSGVDFFAPSVSTAGEILNLQSPVLKNIGF